MNEYLFYAGISLLGVGTVHIYRAERNHFCNVIQLAIWIIGMWVFKWYWVLATIFFGGYIVGSILLKPAKRTFWVKWALWISGLLLCLFALSNHYEWWGLPIFNNRYALVYLFGMILLLGGSVRRSADLQETVGTDSATQDRSMQLAIVMTLALSVAGAVRFMWWLPLVGYVLSFIFVLMFNVLSPARPIPTSTKLMIYIGFITSGLACIVN